MSNIKIDFSQDKGVVNIYGQPMLFHCNHYNRFLQQTIEDPHYINSEKIFLQAAAETVYLQFSEYFRQNPKLSFRQKLDFASDVFKFGGFGVLDFSGVTESGGNIVGKSSHYGLALKLNTGERKKAGEYFDKGYAAGVLLAIKDSSGGAAFKNGFDLNQTKSVSLGDDVCEFEIANNKNFPWLEKLKPATSPSFIKIPARKATTPINEDLIVKTLAGMAIVGNEVGLIPAFGVYLTRMYADYYNKISFSFEQELKKAMGGVELARELLTEAGHICAFNTFGGIMKSDEWKGLILPMIKTKEDWVHGITAVINALGWGIWRVEELVPNEKLVMRAYEDYESLGQLKWFGKTDHHVSYLFTGGCAGIMNLLYHGDITQNPALGKEYYYQLFKTQNCFKGRQIKCLAMGDDYSEVVVTR